MTGAARRGTRAERLAMPLARNVVKDLAAEHGACLRPVQLRRTEIGTGHVEQVLIPCGHTLASVCPPCAERARILRATQCREGWHLDREPAIEPDPATGEQSALVADRAEAQADRDALAGEGLDTQELDERIGELDEQITDAGMRGNVLPNQPRRHRSTRRRQDATPLPRRPVSARTLGKTYTAPDGKTFRPSMFVTLTCPSYGRVGEDGTPADPDGYDYARAARDALHFAALFDRFIQNLRRLVGYDLQKKRPSTHALHARRLAPDGRALPCRPYSYDTVRCFHTHAEDDPAIGRPIEAKKLGRRAAENATEAAQRKLPPGLEPKTVVNTHRMLHRAWEDFAVWGWAKRNVVADAHPPRVPRKGRKVWTVAQLQTFLQRSRSDRFFALWVLEATSGMRRCELAGARHDLLDLDGGTLAIQTTRVVVDGRVIESDGKTENAQHLLALDPFTLAALKAHVEMLDRERKNLGPDYHDHGVLFCWPDGRPPHPDTITRRFKQLAAAAGLPEIDLHDVRHSYATAGRDAKIDWKALSQRIGHADVAFTMKQYVQTDLEADRQVANTLAALIIGGTLASTVISAEEREDQGANANGDPGEAA